MAIHCSRKDAEQRRLHAMTLLKQGYCQSEVTQQLGVTTGSVPQWIKAHYRDGLDALKANVHPCPKSNLSRPQMQQLQKLLLKGAKHHGFASELWTLARIVEMIVKHFAVTYDPPGV